LRWWPGIFNWRARTGKKAGHDAAIVGAWKTYLRQHGVHFIVPTIGREFKALEEGFILPVCSEVGLAGQF